MRAYIGQVVPEQALSMLCLFIVYFETNSLILRKWKAVSLTVLRACTNQVDDVLVPSNILHRVHFRQEVSQLVLSSISWKIWQIIDYLNLLLLPPVLKGSWEVKVLSIPISLRLSWNCLFGYCSTPLVRRFIHYLASLCVTESFGYPVLNGGGNSEDSWTKVRFLLERRATWCSINWY